MKDPILPLYAHHRLLQELVKSAQDKKLSPKPEELDKVALVFQRAGGSWERFYNGSTDDLLLKKVVKVAVKCRVFTESLRWDR